MMPRNLKRLFTTGNNPLSMKQRFWNWTTQERPKWSESYKEATILFCVFGVTGSSSVYFVRPCLKYIGVEGTFTDGPWSYRIASVLIVSPIYACILFTIGTLSGRHLYFANMSKKILGRFFPSSVITKQSCNKVVSGK
jgi:hypothetical protein